MRLTRITLFLLLIVSSIFAIIFSMPYIMDYFNNLPKVASTADKYYSKKKLSLDKAEDHNSEVDRLFDYVLSYDHPENNVSTIENGKKKYGEKFFLALVQKDCAACEERYEAFETLEKEWNIGSYSGLDREFRLYTIYVDTKKDDVNLFEKVYEKPEVTKFMENTISYMMGDYAEHPYRNNTDPESYDSNLKNLMDRDEISTPVTFLFDFTNDNPTDWTNEYGVREVLFSFSGQNGTDKFAKARTLRDAWINNWANDNNAGRDNVFSPRYRK